MENNTVNGAPAPEPALGTREWELRELKNFIAASKQGKFIQQKNLAVVSTTKQKLDQEGKGNTRVFKLVEDTYKLNIAMYDKQVEMAKALLEEIEKEN